MRLIKRTLQEFRSAAWAYTTSTLVIALGIAVFSFFGLIYFNLIHFTERVAQELVLNVYLKPGFTEKKAALIIEELKNEPLVAKVTYLSPQEELNDLKKLFPKKDLLAGVTPDFLPPVLVVSFKDPFAAGPKLKEISSHLSSLAGVYKVQFANSWLARLVKLKRFLEILSLSGLILIGLATSFIIGLVVRFSLAERQKELEVLSLVGATPHFIQGPIIVLAAAQGLLASGLALLLVYFLKVYFDKALKGFFPGFTGGLVFWGGSQIAILSLGVVLLCVIGSYWSSRCYLRY